MFEDVHFVWPPFYRTNGRSAKAPFHSNPTSSLALWCGDTPAVDWGMVSLRMGTVDHQTLRSCARSGEEDPRLRGTDRWFRSFADMNFNGFSLHVFGVMSHLLWPASQGEVLRFSLYQSPLTSIWKPSGVDFDPWILSTWDFVLVCWTSQRDVIELWSCLILPKWDIWCLNIV